MHPTSENLPHTVSLRRLQPQACAVQGLAEPHSSGECLGMMVPSPPCSHPETCTSSALPSRASASPTLGVTHFRYRRGPAESKADLGEMRGRDQAPVFRQSLQGRVEACAVGWGGPLQGTWYIGERRYGSWCLGRFEGHRQWRELT